MHRRAFLGAVGSAASVGYLSRAVAPLLDASVVRVWVTEAAARHDGLEARVSGYLRAALEPLVDGLRVEFAEDPVSLSAEGGREVLADEWPRTVVEGLAGAASVDPAGGVNLLVTDGDPTRQPAGYARPRVAAVTGAGAIATMPPAADAGEVTRYSVRTVATQLLLHECGHALGADHDHGTARIRDGAVVASPMIGSYLWASPELREKHLAGPGEGCGPPYPTDPSAGERRLSLRYSACAARAIRERHDRLVP